MKNVLKIVVCLLLCAVIVVSLGMAKKNMEAAKNVDTRNPNVTIVTTPEQEGFEEHPDFEAPTTAVVDEDLGENLARRKPIEQDGCIGEYYATGAVDGNISTYWEGAPNKFPNQLTVNLGWESTIDTARILLNPDPVWGSRVQEIEVQVSTDGETFTTVFEKAGVTMDYATGNVGTMQFEPVAAKFVRFIFYSNTGATGGQAAEIEIYGVG